MMIKAMRILQKDVTTYGTILVDMTPLRVETLIVCPFTFIYSCLFLTNNMRSNHTRATLFSGVLKKYFCDKDDDCGDNSDEPPNCLPHKCLNNQFLCKTSSNQSDR